jgi:hypothetical protein
MDANRFSLGSRLDLPTLRGMRANRWSMLTVLFAARVAMGFQFQTIASSAPSLGADLGLRLGPIATLIGLYMLPGMVIALPGGLLAGVGLAIGPGAGAIVGLPARLVAPHNRIIGFGVFYTAYYLVMATGPGLAGWAFEVWGSVTACFVVGSGLFVVGVPLLAMAIGVHARGRSRISLRTEDVLAFPPRRTVGEPGGKTVFRQ